MADYDVTITYDGIKFIYRDQHGNDASTIYSALKDQTVRWKLHKYGSKLKIDFNYSEHHPFKAPPPPLPLTAKTEAWTDTGTFNNNHKKRHRYTVTAYDANGAVLHWEDPRIIFGDGTDDDFFELSDDTLKELGTAAQSAFQGLLSSLTDAAAQKRDPNGKFFPGGINNIQVEVTVPAGLSSITVSITVSGSEPTALFPPEAAKK
jgi:hypothetical protein